MKRSKINEALREMESMAERCRFKLPPFCSFTPEQWAKLGREYDEVRDNMLGWDITDFGRGDFDKVGFSLITLRNGNIALDPHGKTYAEKLLYIKEGQSAAMHFHWEKMEDIINRGGGNVLIRVYNAGPDGELDDREVTIYSDGRKYPVPPGSQIKLRPGESITITPYMYHDFELEPGTGCVLLGEVSMCNDDKADNRFYQPMGRFPEIVEDEQPYRLLCNEYPV